MGHYVQLSDNPAVQSTSEQKIFLNILIHDQFQLQKQDIVITASPIYGSIKHNRRVLITDHQ
jgi:ABC-type uncharacterized transport system YnjBCD substrate-binding protein